MGSRHQRPVPGRQTTCQRRTFPAIQNNPAQNNPAQPDDAHSVAGSTSQAYMTVQGTRSRGINMKISGEISPGLKLAASYTWWNGWNHHGQPMTTDRLQILVCGFTGWQ